MLQVKVKKQVVKTLPDSGYNTYSFFRFSCPTISDRKKCAYFANIFVLDTIIALIKTTLTMTKILARTLFSTFHTLKILYLEAGYIGCIGVFFSFGSNK